MEAWVKLSAWEWSCTSKLHDGTCTWVGALTNWASQADNMNEMNVSDYEMSVRWNYIAMSVTVYTGDMSPEEVWVSMDMEDTKPEKDEA